MILMTTFSDNVPSKRHNLMHNLYRLTFYLLLSLMLFIIAASETSAQKVLWLEKGSKKTKIHYSAGDPILFKLKNRDQWIVQRITKFDYDLNLMYLEGLVVNIDSIAEIKGKWQAWPKNIGNTLLGFGVAGMVFSIPAFITKNDAAKTGFVWSLGATIVGAVLRWIKGYRHIYKIKNKYKLRLVDTDFYIIPPELPRA